MDARVLLEEFLSRPDLMAPTAEDLIAGNTGATWTTRGSAGASMGDMRRYLRDLRSRPKQPGPIERDLLEEGDWPTGTPFRGI
jgi:hypothetical protein